MTLKVLTVPLEAFQRVSALSAFRDLKTMVMTSLRLCNQPFSVTKVKVSYGENCR